MSWHDECNSWISRIAASRNDDELNDVEFEIDEYTEKANRTILSLASPIMRTAFYGSLAEKPGVPIVVEDGTPRGFMYMLDFVYNEDRYSIKDLLDGREEISECDDLKKLMELAYFGDKYQINSLLSFCRNILIYKIKLTNENVVNLYSVNDEFKTVLNTEYRIVDSSIKVFIDANFAAIFKDAKVTEENCVSEDLMVELLQRRTIANVTEGYVMQVALDYVRFHKELHEGTTWKEVAQRLVPKVIDFSKLSLQELDLTGTYNILPKEVLLKVLTETTEANKNALVGSAKRNAAAGARDININLLKTPRKSLPQQVKTQMKFKVNLPCLFQFNLGDQHTHLYSEELSAYKRKVTWNNTMTWPYRKISWKPAGGIEEVIAGTNIGTSKLLAKPNVDIDIEFEMSELSNQFCLSDAKDGKFMDKDERIEIEILEVNGKPFQEAIAFELGVHFCSLRFWPL